LVHWVGAQPLRGVPRDGKRDAIGTKKREENVKLRVGDWWRGEGAPGLMRTP
jgi:hypothetical protein